MKLNFLNWLSDFPQLKEPMIIYDSKGECGSKLFTEEFSKSPQERNAFYFGASCPSVMRSSKTEQYENYRLSGGTLTFEEYFFSQHL
ncbi:hypothetical protein [Enterococcus plantarum]|uniref:hypothetical protein n=1 Tax=Enterococcus plantarum TaxID=1077675 RepID=UPI001A8C2ADD|nr:hypothetical protein [Enterococcus plantarum]MBO0422723.1 hypothetical protein [Enterococcus plantarum]